MNESSIRLGPREQQIAELLLQGCDNAEIARQLKMARRTPEVLETWEQNILSLHQPGLRRNHLQR